MQGEHRGWDTGMGCRGWDAGYAAWGMGCRVQDAGRDGIQEGWDTGGMLGIEFRVWDVGGLQGTGCSVWDVGGMQGMQCRGQDTGDAMQGMGGRMQYVGRDEIQERYCACDSRYGMQGWP